MNKIFFIIFIFFNSFLYGNIDISKQYANNSLLEATYCIEDKNNTITFTDLLDNKNLKKLQKSNLGYTFSDHWCRVDVFNSSNTSKEMVYYNPRPGVDIIDVNIYSDGKIISKQIGDTRPLENRDLKSIYSNLKFTLDANQTATIITKYHSTALVEATWSTNSIEEFFELQNTNFMWIFLYMGFMFVLMIYKLITYYYIRDNIYLTYAIFVFAAIVTNLSNTGVMHYLFYDYFDTFTLSISSSIFSHIFLASLWIFTLQFFHIEKNSKIFYFISFIIAYNLLAIIAFCYAYIDKSILAIMPLTLLLALVETVILFLFAFFMFIKKRVGSQIFFIGHFIYIITIVYYIVSFSGNPVANALNSMILSNLGTFSATFFMSLALSARFKHLKTQNEIMHHSIEKNKRFTIIGNTIAYVTHQWKQPLSIFGSQVMKLEALIEKKPDTKIVTLKEEIQEIRNNIIFINDTLNGIQSLFQIDTINKEKFHLLNSLSNIKKDFTETNNKIIIDIKNNQELYGNQNLFIHAIKNIIQNSVDALKDKNIQNGQIIISNNTNENILLSISDNAGGIDKNMINSLFNKTYSSKPTGMGIGLSITKDILEKEFQYSISIENIKKGIRVIIK